MDGEDSPFGSDTFHSISSQDAGVIDQHVDASGLLDDVRDDRRNVL